MVQIAGKYLHTESVNFVENLIAGGFPEDKAKELDNEKNLEIKLDGNKVTVGSDKRSNTYELGKETTETGPKGQTHKTTANLNGNVLKISSVIPDGRFFDRELVFSDGGVEVIINGKGGQAKRIYKRV